MAQLPCRLVRRRVAEAGSAKGCTGVATGVAEAGIVGSSGAAVAPSQRPMSGPLASAKPPEGARHLSRTRAVRDERAEAHARVQRRGA
eukprot:CAMPEP_0203933120 /NCGR_PEP_ID=MMETSP0359-20131031/71381_1 /ASSEMBLY_ACC=CAM_ASM_000338 /TAXON_ID=268821 /ORGANISM="Scrippsiella Hangoei, Strain SHTV-5" /LENGTH=87 /DNA_ID=CAMNT_0050862657 /DNA_START=479 /DNA_END=740 /DNA_ORIENTATION=+